MVQRVTMEDRGHGPEGDVSTAGEESDVEKAE